MKCAFSNDRICNNECAAYDTKLYFDSLAGLPLCKSFYCNRGDFRLNQGVQQRCNQTTDEGGDQ